MKIGYVRVSTIEQNESRQIKALEEKGAEKLYIEKKSGKDTNREELKKMIEFCRAGDIIIVESISRIARNTKDLLNIVESITKKGVEFISLKETIDTTTPQGKFTLTVFGALAELERECILQRQKEGIEIAKEQGKYKGKPQMKIDKEKFTSLCAEWRKGNLTATAVMKEMNIKPNTFYRRVAEWNL